MHNYCKTATNNAWASKPTSSLNSCQSCRNHKEEKTATDNKWTSTK